MRHTAWIVAAGLLFTVPVLATDQQTDYSMACFASARRPAQLELEKSLLAAASPERLRAWHDLVASEPHVAGTPGDLRQIERLSKAFTEMGLEVRVHWVWPYLCKPVSAELEIIAPVARKLGISEPALAEDRYSSDPNLLPLAWNAYSGSGDVTAGVVYANYGTKEDFAKLKELGIDCTGKIALARYGGNFRGYKAKFAEQAGCAGLVIFTDPGDSGYAKGPSYPHGGWATPQQVQCGSILTCDYPGDPLTPDKEATEDATRLKPDEVGLPKIPVQPVGWESAQAILEKMTGEPVADRVAEWQGGMPLAYRLTGGDELKVRLSVKQDRGIFKTANVVATLRGAKHLEQKVLVGCHHDAWGFGAADPTCGLILVLEAARVFSDEMKKGNRPDRSMVFCAWAAEEFGLIGSTEWVEANADDLLQNGVAYINLDMATMGTNFGASASPALKTLILDAARAVPQCPAPPDTGRRGHADPTTGAEKSQPMSVFDAWMARSKAGAVGAKRDEKPAAEEPSIGDLGGGSDHVGFLCHCCVPSMGFGSSGSRGTSYHSNYDNLNWYRAVVTDDYLPAQMNTRMLSVIMSRLANADVLPMDVRRIPSDFRRHAQKLAEKAKAKGLTLDVSLLEPYIVKAQLAADGLVLPATGDSRDMAPDAAKANRLNETLQWMERGWMSRVGMPGRVWYRNTFVATDRDSGYASWMLPVLAQAIEDGKAGDANDQKRLDISVRRYAAMLEEITARIDRAAK